MVNGNSPNFRWVGRAYDGDSHHASGWEASFFMDAGPHKILAHADVFDDGESQSSFVDRKTNKDGIDLLIQCGHTLRALPAPSMGDWGIIIAVITLGLLIPLTARQTVLARTAAEMKK